MEEKQSLNTDYFDKVYEANDDPWDFVNSDYEAAKYAATIAALPKAQYNNALEIGCSIGVLTALLAKHCKKLLATDVSDIALKQAMERCGQSDSIRFQKLNFVDSLPNEQFDLIVISEVAYYLSTIDWASAIVRLQDVMQPTANVILVHWLPNVHDYPQTGDEVHNSFAALVQDKMTNVFTSRAEKYRIDVWEKN